jgi:hypothetical protein
MLLNAVLRDAVLPAWGAMAYQLALLAAFTARSRGAGVAAGLVQHLRIEQRFGFNRMTLRSCGCIDLAKGAAVGALIGLPLAALILWIMGASGRPVVAVGLGAWVGFNLVLLVLYPTLIAPLFNKFEPLPDEALKARVQALMQRCGFAAKGLFVMDGSKRSAHANAYFTGLGAAKRVVFFDTLLQRLTPGRGGGRAGPRTGPLQAPPRAQAHGGDLRPAWPAWRCWAGWPRRAASTPAWAWRPTWRAQRRAGAAAVHAGAAALHFLHRAAGMAQPVAPRTNSRPTPMPARRPAAPTWPMRC